MTERTARIDLLAPPFSGHLHPLLGIGRALAPHYNVRMLSSANALGSIRAAGLDGVALMEGVDSALTAITDTKQAVRNNPLYMHQQFRQAVKVAKTLAAEISVLYSRDPPDLLIADFTAPTAGLAAHQLGVPWWTSVPSPCILETPDGPPAYFGGLPMPTGPLNEIRDWAGRLLIRVFKRCVFWLHRSDLRSAGLTAPYRPDGLESSYSPDVTLALGIRELEFPRRWTANVHFVGPYLYTPPLRSPEPQFRAGARHVLVTLGTHLGWRKEDFAAAVRAMTSAFPDVMFHYSDGDSSRFQCATEGNFQRLSFVDYERWLSRYDLVLHHGGAGILYYCIANGKPALVYPLDYDQFDHAARLLAAGLAHRLRSPRDLEAAVRRALDDEGMRQRCVEFRKIYEAAIKRQELLTLVDAQIGLHRPKLPGRHKAVHG